MKNKMQCTARDASNFGSEPPNDNTVRALILGTTRRRNHSRHSRRRTAQNKDASEAAVGALLWHNLASTSDCTDANYLWTL